MVPILLALAGCTSTVALPLLEAGTPLPLEPADAVAAADLDSDGRDEIVRVRDGTAYWRDQQAELDGIVQGVGRGDTDGDGRQEAIIATGMGRGRTDVPARVWSISSDGAQLLWERRTARSQVADLHVLPGVDGGPDRVFVAAFSDASTVQGGFLVDGELQVQHEARLAMAMLPVDQGLLVGRLYGDDPKSDGDLRLEADTPGETPAVVPTHRGVRALAAADLDGDGSQDWLIADGWHYAYGQQADATVRLIPGDGRAGRVIARLDDSYSVDAIEVVQPADGGPAVILASGSHQVVLLQPDSLGFQPTVVAAVRETGTAVFLRDGKDLAVLVSGEPAVRVPLARGTAMLDR